MRAPGETPLRPLRLLAHPGLDSVGNPYTTLLHRHLRPLGVEVRHLTRRSILAPADILHVHWPEDLVRGGRSEPSLLRRAALHALVALRRRTGAALVWTVHNLRPHEGNDDEYRWMAQSCDGWITMTDSARGRAVERYPALGRVPSTVVRHGHYRDWYPDHVDQEFAREKLAVPKDEPAVLLFGALRSYKQIPTVLDAIGGSLLALVAGPPEDADTVREIRQREGQYRLRVSAGFVPDDEVQLWFRAADILVLGAREALHSGSAMLALSFALPILAPDTPEARELRRLVGADWVSLYSGALNREDVVTEAANARRRLLGTARPDLRQFDWSASAHRTLEMYRRLVDGRGMT